MKKLKLFYILPLAIILSLTNCNSVDPMTSEPDPVEMEEELTVSITVPTKIDQGTEVTFESAVTGDPDNYEWSIPGGFPSDSADPSPTAVFGEYGVYDISLTVSRSSDGATATATSQMMVCLTDGLIAYYPLNGSAIDEGPSEFPGTVNGANPTTNANGDANSAMSFDGVDDFIETTNMIDENFENGGSFSVWVNLGTTGLTTRILANYNGAADGGNCLGRNGFSLTVTDVEGFRLTHSSDGNDYRGRISEGGILTPGTWHHIVSTWTEVQNSESMALYLDGTRVDAENFQDGFTCSFQESEQAFNFGRTICGSGPCGFYNGAIDEVKFYDRALTEDEIKFLGN